MNKKIIPLTNISNSDLTVYPWRWLKKYFSVIRKSIFTYRNKIRITYFHIVTDVGHFVFLNCDAQFFAILFSLEIILQQRCQQTNVMFYDITPKVSSQDFAKWPSIVLPRPILPCFYWAYAKVVIEVYHADYMQNSWQLRSDL